MKTKQYQVTSRWIRWMLSVLCAILIVAILTALSVVAYANYLLSLMERPKANESVTAAVSSAVSQISTVTAVRENGTPVVIELADKPAQDLLSDGTVNILLTGQDRREDQTRGRADVIVLCSFDTRSKTLTLVSFDRGAYVTIPGQQPDTTKMAFQYGGYELLSQTLNYNYGVQIDGNLSIDFYHFIEAIDYIGGLDIPLTDREAEELNATGNMDIIDHEPWSLCPGVNHLDGNQVLAYSRLRFREGDFTRMDRHRLVLQKLLEKFQTLDLMQMNEALTTLLPMISTDMSNTDILSYGLELLPILSECRVVTQQIPAEDTYEYAIVENSGEFLFNRSVKAVIPDLDANRQLLSELLPS